MKISERKQRLRARGVVPIADQPITKATTSRSTAGRASSPPRNRQLSPRMRLTFGVIYVVFAPVMLVTAIVQQASPKVQNRPGVLEFVMPILLFGFGVWCLYRWFKDRDTHDRPTDRAVSVKRTRSAPADSHTP